MNPALITLGIVSILAVLWGIPVLIAFLFTQEWDLAILFGTMGFGALILILSIYGIVCKDQSPDLATLKKSEYVCTRSHIEPDGVLSTRTVCDTYERQSSLAAKQ